MRFDVKLTQKYTETITIVVEADGKDEAKKKAVAYARQNPKIPTQAPEYTPDMVTAQV